MQTLAANSAFTTKKNNLIQAPAKICMHLTNPAKSDFRVMRDARTLIAAGYKVTIIDAEQDRSLPAAEEIDGVCLKHVFVPGWFTPAPFKLWFLVKFSILFIYCVMHLLREDAELYHAHVEKALPACYAVARLRRKPLIFDAPDLTLSDPHLMRWRRLRKLAIGFLAHMVARCAAVVTASPYYVPVLRNLYRASNVIVLRNVPVYQAVDSSDRLRQHLGLGSDTRIVLYQGNIQANRRLDKVIRAAKFFNSGIVLVLMGFADDTSRSQLAELIASEGVAERVKMLPPAPYTELLSWTASADIGLTIFPPEYSLSIKFTLPNKLFEYMMAGLPVLSAPLAAISEIIKTYDIGRIAPSLTPDDLGAAINGMLADPAALASMRENALEAARREFHWENEGQKLVQLYQTILAQRVF